MQKIKQISLKAKIMFTSSSFLPFFTLVFKYLHSLVFFIMFVLKFLFLNFFIGSKTGIIRNCGTKLGSEANEAVCKKRKYCEGVQYQIGTYGNTKLEVRHCQVIVEPTAIPNWSYGNAKLEATTIPS